MTFILEVDGKGLAESDLIVDFRVHQKLSLPAQCEVSFLAGSKPKWQEKLGIGKSLRVRVSKPYQTGILFEGTISACEFSYYPGESGKITIRAYDPLYLLRRRQVTTSYSDCTLSSLASKILQAGGVTGITPQFSRSASSPVWKRLIQSGVNDLKFLTSRCAACGVFFSLQGKKLHFFTLRGIDGPPLEITGDSLLEASFEVNGLNSRDKVTSSAWSSRRGETFRGSADQPRVGRRGNGAAKARKLAGMKALDLSDCVAEDANQAAKLAQAELDCRAANEFTFRGVIQGNPAFRPGAAIKVQGIEPNELTGEFVLAEVDHVYSEARGYVSELSTEVASPLNSHSATTLLLGKVSKVNDPDGLGRIQATLPALQSVETDWLHVLMPGVGKGKGLVALPNIDDTVAILCIGDDLTHGFVLGSILGANKPKVSPVEGGAVQKYSIHSAKGLEVVFDDSKGVLSLACAGGGAIKISSDGISLTGKKISLEKG